MDVAHFSTTAHAVTATSTLLLVAVCTLALSRRLKLPFTVVLVLVGIGLSQVAEHWPQWLGVIREVQISPDLILYIFLPTLIFESTYNLDSQQLRQNIGPVITLAVPGLVISTLIIGSLVTLFTDIPWIAALLLGAILSATDPVAVIALFRQLGAPQRLIVLVEGESLFNDATSIVLAKILIGILAAGTVSDSALTGGIVDFFVLFVGGLLVGWLLGLITGWLLGLVESDAAIEITLTTALAYLSFLLAEEVFHVSGVMATVSAGVTLGGWGRAKISPPVRDYLEHFWEYMAFVANALIFLLVGMKVDLQALISSLDILAVVIVAMLIGRSVIIHGLMPLVGRLPGFSPVSRPFQLVMNWGGLRGAIALAIVLGLEHSDYSELFVALVMGAVLFTLLVQGLSMGRLIHALGLDKPPLSDRVAEIEYRIAAGEQSLERLPSLMVGGRFSNQVMRQLRESTRDDLAQNQHAIAKLRAEELTPNEEISLLYLRAFSRERSLYNDMFAQGHLSESAYRQLLLTLSLQVDGIRSEGRFVHVRSHRWRRFIEPYVQEMLESLPGLSGLAEQMRLNRLAINYENDWAHFQAAESILHWLSRSIDRGATSPEVARGVIENYTRWHEEARERLDRTAVQYPEFIQAVQHRLGRRTLLLSNEHTLQQQVERGSLPRSIAERLNHDLRHQLRALRGQEVARLHVDPVELLQTVPFFRNIPAQDAAALANRLVPRTYEEQRLVVREGDTGQSLFLIARGVLRVLRNHSDQRLELGTLVAGEFFGEMALLHDAPRTASVETVSPCSLYELKRSDLARAMTEHPQIRAALEEADRRRTESRMAASE